MLNSDTNSVKFLGSCGHDVSNQSLATLNSVVTLSADHDPKLPQDLTKCDEQWLSCKEETSTMQVPSGHECLLHDGSKSETSAGLDQSQVVTLDDSCDRTPHQARRQHFTVNEVVAIFVLRPDVRNMRTGECMRRAFTARSKQVRDHISQSFSI